MNRVTKFITNSIALAVATLLAASLPASAGVISVNFRQDAGNNNQQIDADETFGIASLNTVVGGWRNVNGGANGLTDSEGNATAVNLVSVLQPNGLAVFNGAYANTPLNSGFDDYTGTANPCGFTLTNLNAAFPNGYKVIVYVGGFNANNGASISDGTTTYFYQPLASPSAPVSFVQITQTTDLGDGNAPEAQYAVFGDPTLLTSDGLTITINTLYGGGSGLCGFQIVGTTAVDLATRTWKGNLNNDWDTSTLNWTNTVLGLATNYTDGNFVVFGDAASSGAPTVNLTAAHSPASVTVDGTKNYTFTGSGIAGATGLSKKGSGVLTLSNPNTYSNDTTIAEGTIKVGASGAIPDGAGFGDVVISSGATLDLNGNDEGINRLIGLGTVDNTGGAAALTVGLDDQENAFAGTIQGAVSLNKQGTNKLTLGGTATHTGATRVVQGTLELGAPASFSLNSPLVVSNGATLNLNFTNATGLFSLANITFDGGNALTVDYGNASITASATPIITSGALNLTGVTQIGIVGQNFGVGTFTIISYGSKSGAGSISSTPAFLPGGMVATITNTGVGSGAGTIDLVVTVPSVQSLLWTQGDGEWSTNAGAIWNLGSLEYKEYAGGFGDSVTFDNSNTGTVTLPFDVHPFSATVAGNYTLTGPGRITGAVGITRSGASGTTFTLDNTNTYTGVTTVSAGTLQIIRPGALGSAVAGTVVESGASLALSNGIALTDEPLTLNGNGTGSNEGALRVADTSNTNTVSAPITLGANARIRTLGGELIVNSPITDNGSNYTCFLHASGGNGVLRLNSSDNVAGNVTVYGVNTAQGHIVFGVTNVFPTASLTVGGGICDLDGHDQTFAGLRDGFAPNLGIVTNSSASPVTLTLDYSDTNSSSSFLSVLGGVVNVVKQGIGVQSFGGGAGISHTYSGTTTINGGVFGVSSDFSNVTNSFIVNNGGTLRGSGNVIGGPVTVNAGGTFHAGFSTNQVGTLTVSNNLTLAGNTIVALDKELVQSNDVVNVSGTLTYGGTLTVYDINTNGFVLAAGDTFPVFPAGGSGNFSSIVGDPGVTFSFSPLTGILTVDSVGSVTPPSLNYTNLGSGVLQFNWTGAYKLQSQTNAASVGLSTNWVDHPDASNPVNVTNNPAIPTTFFRLKNL